MQFIVELWIANFELHSKYWKPIFIPCGVLEWISNLKKYFFCKYYAEKEEQELFEKKNHSFMVGIVRSNKPEVILHKQLKVHNFKEIC